MQNFIRIFLSFTFLTLTLFGFQNCGGSFDSTEGEEDANEFLAGAAQVSSNLSVSIDRARSDGTNNGISITIRKNSPDLQSLKYNIYVDGQYVTTQEITWDLMMRATNEETSFGIHLPVPLGEPGQTSKISLSMVADGQISKMSNEKLITVPGEGAGVVGTRVTQPPDGFYRNPLKNANIIYVFSGGSKYCSDFLGENIVGVNQFGQLWQVYPMEKVSCPSNLK